MSAADIGGRAVMEASLTEYPAGTVLQRVCVGCGKDYEWVSEPDRQRATIYCSRTCRRRKAPDRRIQRVLLTEDVLPVDSALLICARCWLPFSWAPGPATEDGSAPLYHSRSCKYQAKKDRGKERALARQAARQEKRTRRETEQHQETKEDRARLAAISAAARELLLPATHCTACGKVASPTESAAKEAKRAIEQRAGRTNAVRYYQCDAGWWHWTRMDASLEGWHAEREMTTSPASRRHQGRGAWRHLGDAR